MFIVCFLTNTEIYIIIKKLNKKEVFALKEIIRGIFSWAAYIVGAFVLAALLNIFVFQVTRVQGESMVPTLHNNDMYIISKVGHTLYASPKHGDIVVIDSRVEKPRTIEDDFVDIIKYNMLLTFITKNHDNIYWVKRVIGLPGDVIELRDNKVYRNGEELMEPYINSSDPPRYKDTTIEVTKGHVFVMGDNRNHSSDSRYIGLVPIRNVLGTLGFKLR